MPTDRSEAVTAGGRVRVKSITAAVPFFVNTHTHMTTIIEPFIQKYCATHLSAPIMRTTITHVGTNIYTYALYAHKHRTAVRVRANKHRHLKCSSSSSFLFVGALSPRDDPGSLPRPTSCSLSIMHTQRNNKRNNERNNKTEQHAASSKRLRHSRILRPARKHAA